MTNLEKIKQMSDEELAEFLITKAMCESCNFKDKQLCSLPTNCFIGHKAWLNSEVEE